MGSVSKNLCLFNIFVFYFLVSRNYTSTDILGPWYSDYCCFQIELPWIFANVNPCTDIIWVLEFGPKDRYLTSLLLYLYVV